MSRNHHDDIGEGVPWSATDSRNWRARIRATLPAPCTICGRLVHESEPWDVDHINGVKAGNDPSNLGPAHRKCNRSAGGTLGAAKTNRKRKTDERRLAW